MQNGNSPKTVILMGVLFCFVLSVGLSVYASVPFTAKFQFACLFSRTISYFGLQKKILYNKSRFFFHYIDVADAVYKLKFINQLNLFIKWVAIERIKTAAHQLEISWMWIVCEFHFLFILWAITSAYFVVVLDLNLIYIFYIHT